MIEDGDEIDELDLTGYVALGEHGFALPCFSSGPHPNRWHVAVSSISGNHRGTVVRFDQFSPQEIRRVSAEKVRRVRVGEPWCDVFLWKGQHFVGTPHEIWKALSEDYTILLNAPLTTLDLAQAAGAEDSPRYAKDAYKYLDGRFGRAKAQLWRRDNYLRPHAIQYLQQLFIERKLSEGAGLVHLIEVIEQPKAFSVEVPDDLYDELARSACSDGFLRHLQKLADPFRMSVDMLARANDTGAAIEGGSLVASLKEADVSSEERYDGDNILLVVLGRRAEEIARHVRDPEWAPMWSPGPIPQWRLNTLSSSEGRLFERVQKGKGKFDIIYGGDELPSLNHYAVVVVLVDDDTLMARESVVGRPLAEIASQKKLIRLVAPALPRDQPAHGLVDQSDHHFIELTAWTDTFDAILDTSTARSPFWAGHPRRALERRVADTLLGAAMLAATRGGLSDCLLGNRTSSSTPVLTLSVNAPHTQRLVDRDSRGGSIEMGILSEAGGTARYSANVAGGVLFASDFNAKWLERRGAITRGVAQIKSVNPEFGPFAQQVVSSVIASLDEPRPGFIGRLSSSVKLAGVLQFPKLLHTVGVRKAAHVQRLAVIAETPDIHMVQVASDEGCALVRYTDHETIREFVAPGPRDIVGLLPREVQLPNIRRLPQNRHLATRGIDPRDVVMLSKKQMDDLRKRGPATLLECIRRYRADIEAHRGMMYTVPRSDLNRAITATVRGAYRAYLERLDPGRSLPRVPAKRPSDLRVAWSKAPSGSTRFVVADGVLPIRLSKLPRIEVPAQKLFIVDGDAAVPALLQSRVFSIWARATLSRSTSWTPRFSVGGTFETFPILPPFELQPSEGSTSLILRASDKRLYSRSRKWLEVISSEPPNFGDGAIYVDLDLIPHHPLRRALDVSILDVYGLPSDASDLDIMRRLLVTNTRS